MTSRKVAFVLAGFLTAMVAAAVILMSGMARPADAGDLSASVTVKPSLAVLIAPDAVYVEREARLQAHLAELRSALETMDAAHQQRIEQAQSRLADIEAVVRIKTANLAGLQDVSAAVQRAIDQDAALHQQQLAALQLRDLQMQQQLATTLAELQAAYDEIGARQSAVAMAGGDGGGQGDAGHHEDEHEEHEDHGGRDDDD